MLGRLNHVAMAVPDLDGAIATYRDTLNATVSERHPLPEHGVTVAFVDVENTRLELMEPLGDASPLRSFLTRNPDGGIHHICFETQDLAGCSDRVRTFGARLSGTGEPRIGAHDKPVLFLHPKSFHGALIELEESA
jgi:methylmalonyl-CoA/ethylmalonyl-CoA epimerase